MSQEVSQTPSSARARGGARLLSRAIARSTSKTHKGHTPSSSVPAVPFSFTIDQDYLNAKDDVDDRAAFAFPSAAKDKEFSFSGIKLEIPQDLPTKSPASVNSAVSATMIVAPFGNNLRRETVSGKATTPIYSNAEYGQTMSSTQSAAASNATSVNSGSQNPQVIYQHIHDMASKRISTLDYLRKA